MSKPYFEWRQNSPSELAQYVQLELPEALRWPKHTNRLDLLTEEGEPAVVEQLYKLLLKRYINYDLAPFEARAGIIQQIRKPQTILDTAQGTCLDLAVLLAGICLANDLLPIIIAVDGHAFLGVSLTDTRRSAEQAAGSAAFEKGVLEEVAVLRQWAEGGNRFLFVECTGAARSQSALDPRFPEGQGRGRQGTMTFEQACQAGLDQILKYTGAKDSTLGANQRGFLYALHIHDLQVKYSFPPVKDDDEVAKGPAPQARHEQRIGGKARVGMAVNGPVTGNINHTEQSGGINFGSGNEIGSISDIVAGDKIGGDKVAGDKIDARDSQGFINKPQAPVTQVYGTQRNINTGGGDYAERDIYKGVVPPPRETAVNRSELSAAYGQLVWVRRQVEARDADLAHDLGEVIGMLDTAMTALDKSNTERYLDKLRQAREALSRLAAGRPELQNIVQMLEAVR